MAVPQAQVLQALKEDGLFDLLVQKVLNELKRNVDDVFALPRLFSQANLYGSVSYVLKQ